MPPIWDIIFVKTSAASAKAIFALLIAEVRFDLASESLILEKLLILSYLKY